MATETLKREIKAYDGTTIIFYPNSHRYKIEGEKTYLLSPSSVVGALDKSQALLTWNDNLIKEYAENLENRGYEGWEVKELIKKALVIRTEKLDDAKEVGDIVHDYAETTAYAKAFNMPLPEIPEGISEQAMMGIQAFIKFDTENQVKYHEAERFVFSKATIPYSGKFDAIIEVNGEKLLVDYKSAKRIYSSALYQTAGYDIAMIEEYKARGLELPYEKIAILHFDKNTGVPTLRILTPEERTQAQECFKALLIVKNTEKKLNTWGKE